MDSMAATTTEDTEKGKAESEKGETQVGYSFRFFDFPISAFSFSVYSRYSVVHSISHNKCCS